MTRKSISLRVNAADNLRRGALSRITVSKALLILLVLSALFGAWIWQRDGAKGSFYQSEFGSALSVACGHGFQNILQEKQGRGADLLRHKKSGVTCAEVFSPENAPVLGTVNVLQRQTIGFQYLYARLWALFGLDWRVTALVTAAFMAMSAGAVYMLARHLLAPWPSLAIAALCVAGASPLSAYLIHVRDFSKAPFVLMLSAMVIGLPFARSTGLVMLAGLAGLVAAIGTSFRTDVSMFLAVVPLVLAVRLVFAPDRIFTIAALVTFAVAAIGFDTFVLDYSSGLGPNNAHFAVLGQASPFVSALQLDEAHQGAFYRYNDHFAHLVVSMHAKYMGMPPPGYATPAYDAAGRQYLIDYLVHFPADVLTVAFTAAHRSMFGFVPPLVSLALLVLTAARFRWRGVAFMAVLLLLGGLSGLQFDPRHYFHLRVATVICAAAVVSIVVVELLEWRKRRNFESFGAADHVRLLLLAHPGRSSALFAWGVLGVLAAYFGISAVAQSYQLRKVDQILASIERFPRSQIPVTIQPSAIGTRVSASGQALGPDSAYVGVAVNDPERCGRISGIAVAYASSEAFYDWTFAAKLPQGAISAAYFPLPRYAPRNSVKTITVDVAERDCAVSIFEISPDQRFLPLVYFKGASATASAHQDPALASLKKAIGRAQLAMRPQTCVVKDVKAKGGEAAREFEASIKIPTYLRIAVDPDVDGISSDHFDIGDLTITTAAGALPLSTLPFFDASTRPYPVFRNTNILEKPLRIGNQTFETGLGLHSPARVVIEMPEQLRGQTGTLRFHYGIDAQTGAAGSVSASVCLIP